MNLASNKSELFEKILNLSYLCQYLNDWSFIDKEIDLIDLDNNNIEDILLILSTTNKIKDKLKNRSKIVDFVISLKKDLI